MTGPPVSGPVVREWRGEWDTAATLLLSGGEITAVGSSVRVGPVAWSLVIQKEESNVIKIVF